MQVEVQPKQQQGRCHIEGGDRNHGSNDGQWRGGRVSKQAGVRRRGNGKDGIHACREHHKEERLESEGELVNNGKLRKRSNLLWELCPRDIGTGQLSRQKTCGVSKVRIL